MEKKINSILFIGAPGSGKGTYAKDLALKFPNKFLHFSSGDMFRELSTKDTLAQGKLMSDELTIKLFEETLSDKISSKKFLPETQTILLDGLPRTLAQTNLIQNLINIKAILEITCPEDTIIQRLKGRAIKEGRADDADESIIRNRLKTYLELTSPILEEYKKQNIKHFQIPNTKPILEVAKDVEKVINSLSL